MATKIQKWGNSLGVRIPKAIAELLGVSAGSAVELTVRDGVLLLTPAPVDRPSLDDLLAGMTRANRHDAIDTGPSTGREAW